MLKITYKIEQELILYTGNNIGLFGEFGAIIGDRSEFVIVTEDDNIYLAHISEFDREGVLVKLKDNVRRDL